MSPKWIAGLTFIFVLATAVSLIVEGAYFGQEEVDVLNALTGYTVIEAGGILAIPKLVIGFFTHGLPKLLLWDYVWFDMYNLHILRFCLMALSAAVVWGVIQVTIPVAQGVLARFL